MKLLRDAKKDLKRRRIRRLALNKYEPYLIDIKFICALKEVLVSVLRYGLKRLALSAFTTDLYLL